MADVHDLPSTHKALVQDEYGKPLQFKDRDTPQPGPGSAVIRVLSANVVSYMREIMNGNRKYPYPTPFVPGVSAVGRVAALGPDATNLQLGQLIFFDPTIRGRDEPGNIFLSGIHEGFSPGSKRLMAGEWRDSTYAEFAKVPLENCFPLDEHKLCSSIKEGGLGYSIGFLSYISNLAVPHGGFENINLRPGETVIVAPATGQFGGAAVLLAHVMGARVIALGRNQKALERLQSIGTRVKTVTMTDDVNTDTQKLKSFGQIDAFLDISPHEAASSSHVRSCIFSLKHGGRVSLMGGIRENYPIPYGYVMHNNIQIHGQWMYERQSLNRLIKMLEIGLMGPEESSGFQVDAFGLVDWERAFDNAMDRARYGQATVLNP